MSNDIQQRMRRIKYAAEAIKTALRITTPAMKRRAREWNRKFSDPAMGLKERVRTLNAALPGSSGALKRAKLAADALYHGSPNKIDRLEPKNLHGDPQVPTAVFASPSREFALAYSGGKWGDRDMEQSLWWDRDNPEHTPQMMLQEMRPGAFDETYQQPGYLYHVPGETFSESPRHGTPWEQISENAVTPTQTEEIPNVSEALRASPGVKLLPYTKEVARKLIASKRRIARLREMSPEGRAEYLDWYAEKAPPELLLDIKKLREMVGRFRKSAAVAPGIPAGRKIDPLPDVKQKAWMLAIQKHVAKRAGKHYDLRLVDPKSNKAHSFAVPKARLPRRNDRMLLAIQQPTHTADYALGFTGTIPDNTYGAGKVTMPFKEGIEVIKGNADKIHFQRGNGQRYVLFRTKANTPAWGFKRLR